LQRVLRYGLLFTAPEAAERVMVLGLGGGSVVQTLREEKSVNGTITAVELDAVMIRIADEEFGVHPDSKLRIVCADAFAWVASAPAQEFGLIIIDLFLDLSLPAGLGTSGFWEHIWRILAPKGYVLFNTLAAETALVDGELAPEYWTRLGFEVKEVEVELNMLYVLHKPA
jgi:spermidine synthase